MSFGLLYNGIIKPRRRVMFLFCMLYLNNTEVMTEKQMRPREYIDHLKNFEEKSSLQIFTA